MFAKLRVRRAASRGVDFCESCGQACTAACRAEARLDRIRTEAFYLTGLPR